MTVAEELGLPASVVASQEYTPVDDVCLAILREYHPDIPVLSKIPFRLDEQLDDNFIMVRRINALGLWEGRPGLLDYGAMAIHVYTMDPNGEQKGALISEAVRATLAHAARTNWYRRGIGALVRSRVDEEPNRKSDWMPAGGPVQSADLPIGYWRTESRFMLWVRPPLWG